VFLPGHHAEDSSIDLRALAASRATFVIYMPGHDYRDIADRLLAAELRPDTPCAIVSHAMASDEQVHIATIATLSESPRLPAPSILIVGDVVGQARSDIAANSLSLEADPSLYEPANALTQAEQIGSLAR